MTGQSRTPGRSFETVAVGDELTPLICGPLTTLHLMRFSAAIENWHRIHYDQQFATAHEGLPDLLISGSLKQHLVARMLRSWAGPGAWLVSMGTQFRAMNRVGETLTVWGVVTGLQPRDDGGLVSCELGIRNDTGVESSPGAARIALPAHDAGPLPRCWPRPDSDGRRGPA